MWRDVELRELRIFLVLADELHFGRTAERLGISQPGVSEAVRVLESRLGVKVFDRTSRRVRLTPAGDRLKRSLVPALAALDQALADTSELSRAVRGLLRIGFVLTTEGPALSRLHGGFPGPLSRLRGPAPGGRDLRCLPGAAPGRHRRPVQLAGRRRTRPHPGRRLRLLPEGARRRRLAPPGRPEHGIHRGSGRRGGRLAPPDHPAGGLRPARPPAHSVGAPDPPHPAGPDHQRDPLAGGPGPHRPPDQLDGPHLQPRRRRPHPHRRPASPAARAGLVHQPGEPAHPRPQRNRPVNDRGARLRPCGLNPGSGAPG